jgi:hypothetical protein
VQHTQLFSRRVKVNRENFGEEFEIIVRCEDSPIAVEGDGTDQGIYNGYSDSFGLTLITGLSCRFMISGADLQMLKCPQKGTKSLKL